MATNLFTNGDFETGDLTGWTVAIGTPVVVADVSPLSIYGGDKACELTTAPNALFSNLTANLTAGTKYYPSIHLSRVSTGGAGKVFSVLAGDFGAIRITFSLNVDTGVVQLTDPAGKVLREYTIEDVTKRFIVDLTFVAEVSGVGAGLIIIASPVGGNDVWKIDDAWIADERRPVPLVYPENGPGPIEFQRSFVDPVSGRLVKEDELAIDLEARNRDRSEVDDPNADDIRENYHSRTEYEPEEP